MLICILICYSHKKSCKDNIFFSHIQIKNACACTFFEKMSIFLHFFYIYAHVFQKKVVILQRDLLCGIMGLPEITPPAQERYPLATR